MNFTISIGVKLFPDLPPIVPRIPEMDLIKVTLLFANFYKDSDIVNEWCKKLTGTTIGR